VLHVKLLKGKGGGAAEHYLIASIFLNLEVDAKFDPLLYHLMDVKSLGRRIWFGGWRRINMIAQIGYCMFLLSRYCRREILHSMTN